MEHELGTMFCEHVLDRGCVGDVEPLPIDTSGVCVTRWPRGEIGRDDVVALGHERTDQVVPDLTTSAGEEDLHGPRIMRSLRECGKTVAERSPYDPCAGR